MSDLDSSSDVPVLVRVTDTYSLFAEMTGTGTYDSSHPYTPDGLLNYENFINPITILMNGSITSNYSASGISSSLNTDSGQTSALNKVTLNGTINISQADAIPDQASKMFGIEAVSIGTNNVPGDSPTVAAGPITVITGADSALTVNSGQPDIKAVGISATASESEGHTLGIGSPNGKIDITHNGVLSVTGRSAIGISASTTGAQYANSDATTAIGGDVDVTLGENGLITLSGRTGLGIFAISEVYQGANDDKHREVKAGDVSVTLNSYTASDQQSMNNGTISTGDSDSVMSIGVLAVSSGSNVWVDPFESYDLNGIDGAGTGGKVTVIANRSIETAGKMSVGIAALSLGGESAATTSSGNAGDSRYLGNNSNSQPGDADAVNVTLGNDNPSAMITTLGATSHGIVALSGTGGGIVNNDLPQSADGNGNFNGLYLGSNSSSDEPAALGGDVSVTNWGLIQTGDGTGAGVASIGIVAQSIGGGGGSAGGDHAAAFVGGKGGSGGAGGSVTVNHNAGYVRTKDDNSIGVLAQSIGGGGGNGANAEGIFVAVGGNGGGGGAGGEVDLVLGGGAPEITTEGMYSAGLIGQSIGGGGGHGGSAKSLGIIVGVGIGGKGGNGGAGGGVTGNINDTGSISTLGNNSIGAHLMSVGGGGGTGGAAFTDDVTVNFGMSLDLGGSSGGGGSGGAVSYTNNGVITTGEASGNSNRAPNPTGADSPGLLAQSIGGGGGQAGSATSREFAADDGPSANFSIALGGKGGDGGDGGEINLINAGAITTQADSSPAMSGQSIGGGGGTAGDATAASYILALNGSSMTANVSHGGSGGEGGHGGEVTLQNLNGGGTAGINTFGQHSPGLQAQSIGGGGGSGGLGNAGLLSQSGSNANEYTTSIAIGGTGDKGGNAGKVDVTNEFEITSVGSGSQGILAQAIGGGGGSGGGGNTSGSNNKINMNVSVGGQGGDGGAGGQVIVSNEHEIGTSGGDAVGIMAQSIGGGGGDGGTSDSKAAIGILGTVVNQFTGSFNWNGDVSVGGPGGDGNGSGTVDVTNDLNGTITTEGSRAFGILAQAVSGGGGRGGAANAFSNSTLFPVTVDGEAPNLVFGADVSVGGNFGHSPTGGAVTVTNDGRIETAGFSSHGILAHSIGGGGGVGANGSVDTRTSIGLGVDVSGTNSSSGEGGTVTINQNGNLTTQGGDSIGILAQSIGGGGGVATSGDAVKFSSSGDVGNWRTLSVTADYTLGFARDSSINSVGGESTVHLGGSETGSVSTQGAWSHGIASQSIGGGGGKVGSIYGVYSNVNPELAVLLGAQKVDGDKGSNGDGGTARVTLANQSTVATTGHGASGIIVQSVGGGGGIFSDGSQSPVQAKSTTTQAPPGIQLGATSHDVSGSGGVVSLAGEGTVSTTGGSAHGIILQSIAGGGGIAGAGNEMQPDPPAESEKVTIQLGATEDTSGHAESVSLIGMPTVTTHGASAFGVVAQSVAGGGGIAATTNSLVSANNIGMRNNSGNDRNASTVSLLFQAGSTIETHGGGSHGVVAQSIGGGGGIANPSGDSGFAINSTFNSNGAHGYGNDVSVTLNGSVTTHGTGASGIVAQTIAGGGGLFGGYAGSTGGGSDSHDRSKAGTTSVTVNASSQVHALGTNARGIAAQNVMADGIGGGAIQIVVDGSVMGGSGQDSWGIWMDGGTYNESDQTGNNITIGANGFVGGDNSQAINLHGSSSVQVTNHGTVVGKINLGANLENNNMINHGHFVAYDSITGSLDNVGTMAIGATDSGESVIVNDTLSISPGSLITFDLFDTENYDKLSFQGNGSGIFNGPGRAIFAQSYLPVVGDTFTIIGSAELNFFEPSWSDDFMIEGLASGVKVEASVSEFAQKSFSLQVTAVPEPGSAALLICAAFILSMSSRRRR